MKHIRLFEDYYRAPDKKTDIGIKPTDEQVDEFESIIRLVFPEILPKSEPDNDFNIVSIFEVKGDDPHWYVSMANNSWFENRYIIAQDKKHKDPNHHSHYTPEIKAKIKKNVKFININVWPYMDGSRILASKVEHAGGHPVMSEEVWIRKEEEPPEQPSHIRIIREAHDRRLQYEDR